MDTLKKIKPLTKIEARFYKQFKQAVKDINLYKKGKIKLMSAEEWLKKL